MKEEKWTINKSGLSDLKNYRGMTVTSRKLCRSVRYSGQKVWKSGDWYAGCHYPGPRILVVVRQTDSPYPKFLNAHGEFINTISGNIRESISEYSLACREEGNAKDFVLDGRIAVQHGDGFIDFPAKIPPRSSGAELKLYVDDCYSYSVFKAGEGTQDFLARRKRLKKIVFGIDSKNVRVTHYEEIDSKSRFRKEREDASHLRGFGLVLRKNAPYRAGKSGIVLYVPPEK